MKQKILVRSLLVSVGVSAVAPLAVYPVLAVEPIQWLAYLLLFLIFLAATFIPGVFSGHGVGELGKWRVGWGF